MKSFFDNIQYSIFFILILLVSVTNAQKPYWLEEGGLPQSSYFNYYIGYGESETLLEAKKQAVQAVLQKISDEEGLNFTITGESERKGKETKHNGQFTTDISFSFNTKVVKNGKEIILPSIQEASDYYIDDKNLNENSYSCWVLMRVPEKKEYAKMSIYEPWGAAPVWRSALYPGLGQLYKGQYSKKEKKKGTFLLLTGTSMIAGIVTSQILYNHNHDQAYATESMSQRDFYLDKRDTWGSARYGFAVSAGVIYLYSLIDASANKKVKRYAEIHERLNIQPIIGAEYYLLALKINLNN
ncbi:MAG: hypothetical protein JEZ09_13005 [Salinivirgaceae bacterium]|nr:hypothetical protein [Salinivirgaceae bacterium]